MSNRFTSHIFFACILLGVVLFSCREDGGFSAIENADRDNKVILKIGGQKIFLSSFYQYIKINFSDEELSLDDEVLSRFLDYFIEEQLLLREAGLNMVIVSNSEVNREAAQMRDDYSALSDSVFIDREWRQALKDSLKVKKFIFQYVLKDLNIQRKDIEDYYDSHQEKFKVPEELRVSQILVETEEDAKEIIAQLRRKKDDFHRLAQQYSISPEAARGGDMGYFRQGQLPPEFEKVIFSLKEAQYSSIISSSYGYHIFLLEERRAGGQLSISEVQDDIRFKLYHERSEAKLKEYVAKLKEVVPIKIYYKNLDFQYKKE